MIQTHQVAFDRSSGLWSLANGAVHGLDASGHDRLLCLREGRLWLTGGARHDAAGDRWLQAGDCLRLPAGTAWLAGAEPRASWVLLEAPVAAQGLRRTRGLGLALAGAATLASLAAWARKAAAIARRAQGAISAGDSRASAGSVQ